MSLCQVGAESAPSMAAVVHHILQNGWKLPRNLGQHLVPAGTHLVRERILYEVLKNTCRYYGIWYMSGDQHTYPVLPPQDVVDDMKTGPFKFARFREIPLKLDSLRC